jgi:hypothetical protein
MLVNRRRLLLSFLIRPVFAQPQLAGVRFERLGNSGSRRYLRIHGNENTAAEALRIHCKTHSGVGLIIDNKERTVKIDGLSIDPNRWFSRAGAARNLRLLNPQAPESAVDAVLAHLDTARPELLKAVEPPRGALLIAVHNNGPGYSVEDEIALSERTHLPRRTEPHEFFLCTDPRDFATLSKGPYNAVLQHRAPPPDDGSLSRYAAAHGWRYVNLEVAHGALDKQVEMLNWLTRALPEHRPAS